eukprot:CAMPEP_0203986394 /NCGR_PEP_ID=MMETSP0360-20130528/5997_1 /ASSEMBLY_ACC=CAM_ASM_000342 /TAXON_ID=268821 /ORGANISM="Scrippsiella Hangoei, Strain SHTV-5" /LENGTH=73 /DNA_ID=CAMNT_0050925823 /DNA_START=53 /DNA_END=271 /DNA_ORIENTATION=+
MARVTKVTLDGEEADEGTGQAKTKGRLQSVGQYSLALCHRASSIDSQHFTEVGHNEGETIEARSDWRHRPPSA